MAASLTPLAETNKAPMSKLTHSTDDGMNEVDRVRARVDGMSNVETLPVVRIDSPEREHPEIRTLRERLTAVERERDFWKAALHNALDSIGRAGDIANPK